MYGENMRQHSTSRTDIQSAELLIHQSANMVGSFLELTRDLGREPSWEEFVEKGHQDPEYPIDGRLVLRELWRKVIVPELARMIQRFDRELLLERLHDDLCHIAAHTPNDLREDGEAVTLASATERLFDFYGHIFGELTPDQAHRVMQHLEACVLKSMQEEKTSTPTSESGVSSGKEID